MWGEGGWQGCFMYALYREKGGSPKAYISVKRREGGRGPKFRTELYKYLIEDHSC